MKARDQHKEENQSNGEAPLPAVSANALARCLGVTPKIIYDLTKEGVIERGSGRLFQLEDSVRHLIAISSISVPHENPAPSAIAMGRGRGSGNPLCRHGGMSGGGSTFGNTSPAREVPTRQLFANALIAASTDLQ
jgi:hypothetical protein